MRTLHLSELDAATADKAPLRLLVPTTMLGYHRIPQPAAPRRKWSEIIPWMLEDRLLQSPQELCFTWQECVEEAGTLDVWSVERSRLESWRERCTGVGELVEIVPDVFVAPLAESGWHVLVEGDGALVRTGTASGFACPIDWLPAQITARQPTGVAVSTFDRAAAAPLRQKLEAIPTPIHWVEHPLSHGDLSDVPINLLPADMRRSIASDRATGRRWMAVAVIALAALLSWPLAIYSEARYLAGEAARIGQHLGGSAVDPALQQLRGRAADAGVRDLLLSLDPLVSACAACSITKLVAEPGRIRIELEQPEALLPALQQNGWLVEVESERALVILSAEVDDA